VRAPALICVLAVLLAGCGPPPEGPPPPRRVRGGGAPAPVAAAADEPGRVADDPEPLTDPPADDQFEQSQVILHGPHGESVEVPVYVADEPELRRLGLMHRDELAADAGMVFVYPHDTEGGFWMKNTRIPLSIAYFAADGDVLAVLDMEPCEADPCPTYDPEVAYRGTLEVNEGYFDEVGLDEDWRIELAPDIEAVE
jgi:uncharacterized protein